MIEPKVISGLDIVEYWQYVKLYHRCKEHDMDIKVLSMNGLVDILPKFTGLPETEITAVSYKQVSPHLLTLDTILLNFIEHLSNAFTHQVEGIISFNKIVEYSNMGVKPILIKSSHATDDWINCDVLSNPNFTYIISYAFTEIN